MQAEQITTTVIDGCIFDAETGECLGVWEKPAFHVTDQRTAEWVLEKVSGYDADIAALDARLNALKENMEAMRRDLKQRRDGLVYRFGPELEKFAKDNLPAGKKTWVCPYGSVAFRATQGGVKVIDEDLALEIAKENGWTNALKVTEAFRISLVTPEQKAEIESAVSMGFANAVRAFDVKEPGEAATIRTGVEK
jgi:hypothetical protein